MAQQGRGSAMAAMVLLCLVVLHFELAQAATYTVGGRDGWTFNSAAWLKGKKFKAGDKLVFKYSPSFHNVVKVSRAGYNSCLTPKGSKFFKSGKDQIKLVKGRNYFICSIPGHCQAGMKIAITAV
ncbi:Plastocyanin-like protein [Corchorus olitorius]|uniref:Basic blue protein n=1 Tax=Corchorus olitorius TaxID=93759 RepID=A0A1R3JBB0_9ROSI|nr:Plastocyanin-like protein [Corchorus olitorius]